MADTAYNDDQYAHNYPDGVQDHYWIAARARIVLGLVRRVLKPGEDATVLDVGCGRGLTVDYLRRHGVNALGCELGRPRPMDAGVAPHLHLGQDAFELSEARRRSARVLLLMDVLEHLEDPVAFLARCHERFPICTHVLVTLPARQELWSNYDQYFGHFRRYDRRSLARVFPPQGYELERQGYFFHALYLPARVMAMMGMDRKITMGVPGAAGRPIHRLLAGCFIAERWLLPGWLPGTSLYGLLRCRR